MRLYTRVKSRDFIQAATMRIITKRTLAVAENGIHISTEIRYLGTDAKAANQTSVYIFSSSLSTTSNTRNSEKELSEQKIRLRERRTTLDLSLNAQFSHWRRRYALSTPASTPPHIISINPARILAHRCLFNPGCNIKLACPAISLCITKLVVELKRLRWTRGVAQ